MKLSSRDPGLVVSGVAHAALLVVMLVAFAGAKQFDDAPESIPVDMVTDTQFAQIMKGVKTEKEIKPQPTRVDKVADLPETHQAPPTVEAKIDVPTPPPRLRPVQDPGEDDQPQPTQAPTPPAPPQRPADLPKAEAKPTPPPRPDAEAVLPPQPPQPPQRPKDEPKKPDVAPPLPPTRPVQNTPPKPNDKLKLDEVAKLINASKPKSGDDTADPQPRLDLTQVSQLLQSKDTPQQRASTGRELSHTASLGSPTASAAKMSPSLWGQLDGLMQDQYKKCWSYLGLNNGDQYVPEINVQFTPDGTLIGQPTLRNPPNDPSMRGLAESAMRAVQRCNPLKIPPQYAPYYDQWKTRILRFAPEEMAG